MKRPLRIAIPLLLTIGCAAPRIIPAPPIAVAAPSPPAAVLHPCVLLHQKYKTDASNALDGGGPGKVEMIFASVLVQHPRFGAVVIDPAVGRDKAKDFGGTPWLLQREIGDGSQAVALADLLANAGVPPESVRFGLITHAHFDHIGGAPDIPAARIIVNEPELRFADTAHVLWFKVTPQFEIDRIRERIQTIRLDGPPYEGFASSYDLFGDGSIVAVPTPGHTPGSVSWFVNSADGNRWLFVGDAAWLAEGISRPAHKGWIARTLDAEAPATGQSLAQLHAYQLARPVTNPPDGKGVHLLPAHDARMLDALEPCRSAAPLPAR